MPPSGFRVEGAKELKLLAVELKTANPVLLKGMRRNLRLAVAPIAEQVKAKAAGFSTTIPGSIVVRSKFGGRLASVWIAALASRLPDGHQALARLQEYGSRGSSGVIRHPVFGNTDNWVDQPSHPFLRNTAREHAPEIEAALKRVMDETARAAGFR